MTIVMKMPLKNCLTKCCVLPQSLNSKILKWGFIATASLISRKSMPSFSFTCQIIIISIATRHRACIVSVQIIVFTPLLNV